MRAVDLIRKKRDSGEHSREEINFLISSYTRGEIPDYQMAAWIMATWIRGLSRAEIAALTEAMLHSGEVVNFPEVPGKKVDKHSTGGTLDKLESIPGFNTALSLAEFRRVLAECGMALIGQTEEIAPADKKIYA